MEARTIAWTTSGPGSTRANTVLVEEGEDRIHGLTNVVLGTQDAGTGGSDRRTGYDDHDGVNV